MSVCKFHSFIFSLLVSACTSLPIRESVSRFPPEINTKLKEILVNMIYDDNTILLSKTVQPYTDTVQILMNTSRKGLTVTTLSEGVEGCQFDTKEVKKSRPDCVIVDLLSSTTPDNDTNCTHNSDLNTTHDSQVSHSHHENTLRAFPTSGDM